ncbi:MAG: zinc-ribbon domain-containing protein [Clostridia bacterium]|nr:zinc-ribbon domain-containing protein [Clostridia bacterium]
MDFMAIVREKAAVLAHGAVKTSGAVVETVKSSLAIADKEAETNKIFRQLGALVYEAYKAEIDVDADAVAEKCAALDDCFAEIEALKEKVNDIKNSKTCPACGAKVKGEYKFCPVCGAKMD